MTLDLNEESVSRLPGTAGSILGIKGSHVYSIGPADTVYQAVEKMNEWRVGALFVMEGERLLGVISERDYARKIILQGLASKDTRVDEIMSSPVISVELTTPVAECMRVVTERRIRHLPVKDGERVIGVISIGDLVRFIVAQQAEMIDQLNTVITGPYPA